MRDSLAEAEHSVGRHDPETAQVAWALGRALRRAHRHPEAREHFERALAILTNERGPGHPETAALHHDLAELSFAAGWFVQGQRSAERALDAWAAAGQDDGQEASLDRLLLGSLLIAQGCHDEAEPVLRRALDFFSSAGDVESAEVAAGQLHLAKVLGAQGRVDEAAARYRRAIEIRRRVLGATHPGVASALHDLGVLYEADGRSAEAQDVWREASRILTGAS
ncbi:tetratricopeptide repeat protein [Sporichthya brevicatena]|uniref:tetratricopeptide repeat protein n=1 Tax=Sporichthya brevicatena TaxID=171442 RepID=UPI0031E412D2